MPSRLSSLLVRDGLVGVKRMEKAFQRQVIYGGSLDTILLEMNLIPEERLTQYLALASGLPPAARDEGTRLDDTAVGLVSQELAERYRAVPVSAEGEAVRILVCAPLEITELEDLADLLDRPLQPLITPEYRWHLVYAAAYELDPPARFTTLARSLDVDPAITPVGRAKSVIVEGAPVPELHDATDRTPIPAVQMPTAPMVAPASLGFAEARSGAEGRRVEEIDDDALEIPREVSPLAPPPARDGRVHRPTLIGVNPNRAAVLDRRDGVPENPLVPPVITFTSSGGTAAPKGDPGRRPSAPIGVRPPARPPTAPITTEGRDAPVPIVRARELLATAEDRDTVFLTLLRAARSRARWAGLFTVQGGAAIGRVALAEPGLDANAVTTILIPLDAHSPFHTVVANHQPHIGTLDSGDASIDAMMVRMGGTMPPSVLILPVILRDRVVALVVAHRVHSDIRLADVAELLPMGHAASEALGRLIVKHKSAGYRAPSAEHPVVEIEAESVDTKRIVRADSGGWSAPEEMPAVPSFEQGPVEMSIEAEPPRSIDQVIADIESAKEGDADDAIVEAVDRFAETLGALMKKFPGRLRVDRFSVTGRPLRAAQYGGLLELVIQLGPVASELLIDKMSAPQRDVRFYATVCIAELRPRNAVYALAERLFDNDFGVRACAIEALAGYPLADLGHALVRARRALHSTDPEVVGAAATALVQLADIEAINDLIAAVERPDRGGEHARRALITLTAQDFGPSEKKWRKWWEGARMRHRIEWLIEGLSHKEDAIREGAINDLRRLTGEYFGYHHDLPKREREAAADRWAVWWRDAGRVRFMMREDERHRPTGLLPLRRD